MAAAPALLRAHYGQPGQEGGGVRQRHRGKRFAGRLQRPQARAGDERGAPGAKGPGPRFPPPWVWRARGSGPLVSPSPPLPQLGVRTAGEAGTGWGSHLLPGRGRPHAGAVGFWLKGRRGKRLGLCVPKGLHSPGSPVCKKEKDQEAFLFLYS